MEASRVLGCNASNENTLVDNENEDMETEFVLHDGIAIAVYSKSETFYLKFRATNGNEVCGLFKQFKTHEVDLFKLDQLLMQKAKASILKLEKKERLKC